MYIITKYLLEHLVTIICFTFIAAGNQIMNYRALLEAIGIS